MLGDVTNSGGSPLEMGKYILKLVRLEDEGESQFKEGERRIKWIFHVAEYGTNPPAVMRKSDGEEYEFFAWNNGKMGPNTFARQWSEALLGRTLAEGESGASIGQEIVGKKAIALIGPNKNGRTSILQIEPLVAKKGNGAAAPAQQQLVTAGAGVEGGEF